MEITSQISRGLKRYPTKSLLSELLVLLHCAACLWFINTADLEGITGLDAMLTTMKVVFITVCILLPVALILKIASLGKSE